MPISKIPPVWTHIFRVAAGLIMLVILLTLIDLDELWLLLQNASFPLLLISFLLFALQCVPEAIRLKTAYADWGVGWLGGLRLYTVGMFFNNFMPGVIGADLYQVQQLHATRPGLVRPISMLLLLRVSGLLINVFIALLVLGFGSAIDTFDFARLDHGILQSTSILLLLTLGALILIAIIPWGRSALRIVKQRIAAIRAEVQSAFSSLTGAAVATVFLQGLISVLLRAASLYVVLLAFGAEASAGDVLLAVTVAIIVLVVPITFAGIGIREVSVSAILITSGVEPHIAVAAALVGRLFIWILSLFGGTWFIGRLRGAS